MSKQKKRIDKAVAAIESAANGISGATMMADVAYAQTRRADIGFAAETLRREGVKVDVDAIISKADEMLTACRHQAIAKAVELNIEIGELLAPLCD